MMKRHWLGCLAILTAGSAIAQSAVAQGMSDPDPFEQSTKRGTINFNVLSSSKLSAIPKKFPEFIGNFRPFSLNRKLDARTNFRIPGTYSIQASKLEEQINDLEQVLSSHRTTLRDPAIWNDRPTLNPAVIAKLVKQTEIHTQKLATISKMQAEGFTKPYIYSGSTLRPRPLGLRFKRDGSQTLPEFPKVALPGKRLEIPFEEEVGDRSKFAGYVHFRFGNEVEGQSIRAKGGLDVGAYLFNHKISVLRLSASGEIGTRFKAHAGLYILGQSSALWETDRIDVAIPGAEALAAATGQPASSRSASPKRSGSGSQLKWPTGSIPKLEIANQKWPIPFVEYKSPPIPVGPVPVVITVKGGATLGLQGRIEGDKDNPLSVKATLEPSMSGNLSLSAGVGLPGVGEAGIEASLEFLNMSLPTSAGLSLSNTENGWALSETLESRAKLVILKGAVNAYAEAGLALKGLCYGYAFIGDAAIEAFETLEKWTGEFVKDPIGFAKNRIEDLKKVAQAAVKVINELTEGAKQAARFVANVVGNVISAVGDLMKAVGRFVSNVFDMTRKMDTVRHQDIWPAAIRAGDTVHKQVEEATHRFWEKAGPTWGGMNAAQLNDAEREWGNFKRQMLDRAHHVQGEGHRWSVDRPGSGEPQHRRNAWNEQWDQRAGDGELESIFHRISSAAKIRSTLIFAAHKDIAEENQLDATQRRREKLARYNRLLASCINGPDFFKAVRYKGANCKDYFRQKINALPALPHGVPEDGTDDEPKNPRPLAKLIHSGKDFSQSFSSLKTMSALTRGGARSDAPISFDEAKAQFCAAKERGEVQTSGWQSCPKATRGTLTKACNKMKWTFKIFELQTPAIDKVLFQSNGAVVTEWK